MKHMKLLMMMGIVAIVFAGLAGAAQAKDRKPSGGLNVTLDTYEPNNDGYAGPVRGAKLPERSRWVAVVQGTFSYYAPSEYTHPTNPFKSVCGVPDFSGPMFASPDKPAGGPVGFDSEFIFGRPSRKANCRPKHPLPYHWANFQIKTGQTWEHPFTLGPTLNAPTADHTYSYPITGWDNAVQFRLKDLPRTSDNYGELKISLRPATAADCGNYDFQSWSFPDQATCEATLGGTPAAT